VVSLAFLSRSLPQSLLYLTSEGTEVSRSAGAIFIVIRHLDPANGTYDIIPLLPGSGKALTYMYHMNRYEMFFFGRGFLKGKRWMYFVAVLMSL
jgi:hypothetical protein